MKKGVVKNIRFKLRQLSNYNKSLVSPRKRAKQYQNNENFLILRVQGRQPALPVPRAPASLHTKMCVYICMLSANMI